MSGIWFSEVSLADFDALHVDTLVGSLEIRITAFGEDWLEGTMPVDRRTRQPYGLLHGGASVALAETLGSYAGNLVLDPARQLAVGQEISASHLRSVREGFVTGRATPVHLGARSQVWEIRIRDQADRTICLSRLTVAVLERR